MLGKLKLLFHRWTTRRKMDRVFGRGPDPYGYGSVEYEKGRLDAMEAALKGRRYSSALEVGAAEGAFTLRLASLAERVTGLELSPVALTRAREALRSSPGAALEEADVRTWEPAGRFDLIVCGDVLYYLDKPLVKDEFEAVFPRIAGWLAPGGRLLLAHGFADDRERGIRQGYRERFERLGLCLVSETAAGEARKPGDVRCLLSLLESPQQPRS